MCLSVCACLCVEYWHVPVFEFFVFLASFTQEMCATVGHAGSTKQECSARLVNAMSILVALIFSAAFIRRGNPPLPPHCPAPPRPATNSANVVTSGGYPVYGDRDTFYAALSEFTQDGENVRFESDFVYGSDGRHIEARKSAADIRTARWMHTFKASFLGRNVIRGWYVQCVDVVRTLDVTVTLMFLSSLRVCVIAMIRAPLHPGEPEW